MSIPTRSRFAALGLLAVLTVLVATPVTAGNYAEVDYGTSFVEPPAAGEEREIRVSLLQHGVTPVDHGEVDMTIVDAASGERITVPATSLGDGKWSARVAFPSAGAWQLRVTHSVFETPEPTAITVAGGGMGSIPLPVAWVAGLGLLAATAAIGVVAWRRRPRHAPVVSQPSLRGG